MQFQQRSDSCVRNSLTCVDLKQLVPSITLLRRSAITGKDSDGIMVPTAIFTRHVGCKVLLSFSNQGHERSMLSPNLLRSNKKDQVSATLA